MHLRQWQAVAISGMQTSCPYPFQRSASLPRQMELRTSSADKRPQPGEGFQRLTWTWNPAKVGSPAAWQAQQGRTVPQLMQQPRLLCSVLALDGRICCRAASVVGPHALVSCI